MNLRLILRIARTELAVLFYSPVAWLLLIAFTCQVGFDFMNILTEIVKIKALGNTITFSVTAGFVLGLKGIYEVINDLIKWYSERKPEDKLLYYQLLEDKIYYNLKE